MQITTTIISTTAYGSFGIHVYTCQHQRFASETPHSTTVNFAAAKNKIATRLPKTQPFFLPRHRSTSREPELSSHTILNCQNVRFGVFRQWAVSLRGSADIRLDRCVGAVVVPVDQTYFGWAGPLLTEDQVRRSALALRMCGVDSQHRSST